jgi:hypothetical protein
MSTQKHTLFQSVLARISLGAVPVDGVFWFDPRTAARELSAARALQGPARESSQPAAAGPLERSPCT